MRRGAAGRLLRRWRAARVGEFERTFFAAHAFHYEPKCAGLESIVEELTANKAYFLDRELVHTRTTTAGAFVEQSHVPINMCVCSLVSFVTQKPIEPIEDNIRKTAGQ